jgi:hypothetical protein
MDRNNKAIRRPDIDDLWAKIETLHWVLYVMIALRKKDWL